MTSLHNAIREMEDVLETEAAMLRGGDLTSLPKIEARKRQVWAYLQSTGKERAGPNLKRVKDLAGRNARLLLAARSGIETVQKLREQLAAGPSPLSTYGADGRKAVLITERRQNQNSRSV